MYSPKFKPWALGKSSELRPGKTTRFFKHFIDLAGPLYTRLVMGVDRVEIEGSPALIKEYQDAYGGRSRFLLAFRHPGDNDPQVLFLALNTLLAQDYRKAGLMRYPGSIFLAGAELPLWGGPLVAWALKNAGTIPVSHGSMSRSAMDTILDTIVNSPVPACLAPEGQVSYFSQAAPHMDDGTAQLCLWARTRLDTQARKEGQAPGSGPEIRVLPVGVIYRFPKETWGRLDRYLRDIEGVLGISTLAWPSLKGHKNRLGRLDCHEAWEEELINKTKNRLQVLWQTILDQGEALYGRVYGYQPVTGQLGLGERTLALADFAMARAEAYFGKESRGDLRERVMFLRSHSMDMSFVADPSFKGRPAIEKLLAERASGEAYWLHRHQEFADLGWYLDEKQVLDCKDFNGLIESAQNLADLAMRLVGGNFGNRRRFFKKTVVLRFGTAITWDYPADTPRRTAIAAMTSRIRQGFMELIDDYHKA